MKIKIGDLIEISSYGEPIQGIVTSTDRSGRPLQMRRTSEGPLKGKLRTLFPAQELKLIKAI